MLSATVLDFLPEVLLSGKQRVVPARRVHLMKESLNLSVHCQIGTHTEIY